VAWWSAVLLAALGAVLTALFWSARLLLTLADEPGAELSGRYNHLPASAIELAARGEAPSGAEPLWWHSRELC
jgi:hypothetical protein